MSPWRKISDDVRQKTILNHPDEALADDESIISYCRSLWPDTQPPGKKRLTPESINKAKETAREWISRGVGVIKLDAPDPILLFAQGPLEILSASPLCAVVNSRKPRKIHPHDSWVRATIQMANWAMDHGYTIVSGLGPSPYELAATVARFGKKPVVMVLDQPLPAMVRADRANAFWMRYGNLLTIGRTLLVSPFFPGNMSGFSLRRTERDSLVVRLADTVMVVQANTGGNMHRLAAEAMASGKKVFALNPGKEGLKKSGNRLLLDAGAAEFHIIGKAESPSPNPTRKNTNNQSPVIPENEYLFHYTRSKPGPWPGQDLYEYYKDLILGREHATHSALDTLCRILEEQLVRGSSRMVRGERLVVSLTAVGPESLRDLIQWRRTLARWTMEPYGLAIRRTALESLGAGPVVYGDKSDWESLPEGRRFLFQSAGKDHQWPLEKEWRLPGNLDLSRLRARDVIVLVPAVEEKEMMEKRYPYSVIVLPRTAYEDRRSGQ